MKRHWSLFLSSFTTFTLLVAFANAFDRWWGKAATPWNPTELGETFVQAYARMQELKARCESHQRCMAGKEVVIRALITKKITLKEAVEHFYHLEEVRYEETRSPLSSPLDARREKILYWQVLSWVYYILEPGEQKQNKRYWDNLQQQYRQRFGEAPRQML
jgi:hypothetical protein